MLSTATKSHWKQGKAVNLLPEVSARDKSNPQYEHEEYHRIIHQSLSPVTLRQSLRPSPRYPPPYPLPRLVENVLLSFLSRKPVLFLPLIMKASCMPVELFKRKKAS